YRELSLCDAAARRSAALAELPGHAFDSLGRRREGCDDGRLGCLVAFGRRIADVLQGGVVRLEALQLLAGLGQFVSDHQRRHDGESRVADLAELAAQRDDAIVEVLGELLKMTLLAILAGHAELAAVDGDV